MTSPDLLQQLSGHKERIVQSSLEAKEINEVREVIRTESAAQQHLPWQHESQNAASFAESPLPSWLAAGSPSTKHQTSSPKPLNWVSVKELNLSYHNPKNHIIYHKS